MWDRRLAGRDRTYFVTVTWGDALCQPSGTAPDNSTTNNKCGENLLAKKAQNETSRKRKRRIVRRLRFRLVSFGRWALTGSRASLRRACGCARRAERYRTAS